MKSKLWLVFIIGLVALFALNGTALAAKKGKKKAEKAESSDPYKGRVGIGFSLGGSSGSGGTGFSGAIGVTYYFMKYISANGSVGYGFAPYTWTDSNGDSETVKVNFVPADLSVHFHPLPFSKISPYFGPGAGLTYTWYTFDDEKFEETWYHGFAEAGITYWVGKNFGLNVGVRYSIPYYDDKWQTDDGQLTYGMSGSILF